MFEYFSRLNSCLLIIFVNALNYFIYHRDLNTTFVFAWINFWRKLFTFQKQA